MEKKNAFDLQMVSQTRSHLLGMATLWVALFHSYHLDFLASSWLSQLHLAGVLNRLKELGNCGVDLFLFLSGLGLYYSMTSLREAKTPHLLRTFFARRMARVLPSVLIITILYYGLTGTGGLLDWMGKVFLFGSFLPVQTEPGYWYFALLMTLYLLYPLIDLVHRKWGNAGIIGMMLLSVGMGFSVSRLSPVWFGKLEIMITRLPVFLLGVLLAPYCRNHTRIPRWVPRLSLMAIVAGIFLIPLIPQGLSHLRRYAYAPLTLAMVFADSLFCGWVKWKGFLYKGICLIGTFSMEIYLIYENLYVMNPPLFHSVDSAGMIYALTVFVAAFVLSMLLKLVVTKLREGMEKNS